MKLSYFKEFDYGCLEVVVEFPDDGGDGNVIDTIVHPTGYRPTGKILYEKKLRDTTKEMK